MYENNCKTTVWTELLKSQDPQLTSHHDSFLRFSPHMKHKPLKSNGTTLTSVWGMARCLPPIAVSQ